LESLTYDNLPPGSTILREWKDGALTIISASRDLDQHDRRRAARMAAISSLWLTMAVGGVTGAMLLTFLPPPNVSHRLLQIPVMVLAIIFVLCMFGVFWLDMKRTAERHLERGLAEHNVLIVSAAEIGVEIAGSDAALKIEDVSSIAIATSGFRLHAGAVVVTRRGGPAIELFRGRPPAELRWLATTLRQVIDRSAESPPSPAI
jgi:uncharacterized membrane protein YsdA (DUF1294 family)